MPAPVDGAGASPAQSLRALAPWAAQAGYRDLQLDAAAAGLRPRELGRSARRDLASMLRRSGLGCSGVDLWIPAAHFADPARSDRAVSAVLDALEFAHELAGLTGGAPVLSTRLPWTEAPAAAVTLLEASEDRGVRLADPKEGEIELDDQGFAMVCAEGGPAGSGRRSYRRHR